MSCLLLSKLFNLVKCGISFRILLVIWDFSDGGMKGQDQNCSFIPTLFEISLLRYCGIRSDLNVQVAII